VAAEAAEVKAEAEAEVAESWVDYRAALGEHGSLLTALALSRTAPVPTWHRLRSQSQSRVQTATSLTKWSSASVPAALLWRPHLKSC